MLFDFGDKAKTFSDEFNFVIYTFLNYPGVTEGF